MHDAGGAELLTSLIRKEKGYDWQIATYKSCPARRVIESKLKTKKIILIDEISMKNLLLLSPDMVFFSASWSKKEYMIAKQFKKIGVHTVIFLDHWVNYRESFGYPKKNWRKNLPSYIAVGDEYAYLLAKKLKMSNLLKINNSYLLEIKKNYKKTKSRKKPVLLYLSEIVTKNDRIKNFTFNDGVEIKILKNVFSNFGYLSKTFGVKKLIIRTHPSCDNINIFEKLMKEFPQVPAEIETAESRNILMCIKESSLVLGIKTMPLFVSYLVGKQTFSLLPNSGLPLPNKNQKKEVTELNPYRWNKPEKILYNSYPLSKAIKIIKQ